MKQFFFLFFLLITVSAHAQQEPQYRPGLIVTVTDDTISCLVPMVQYFGVAVLTKKHPDSRYDTIPINRIKYLANGFQVFETVSFNTTEGMKQELMWLKQEGTINLYETFYFDDANQNYRLLSYGTEHFADHEVYSERGYHTKGPPIYIRVIRKNGQTYLLSDKYFKAILGPLVADKPEVAAKVNSKKYTLESIDHLVAEYNAGE